MKKIGAYLLLSLLATSCVDSKEMPRSFDQLAFRHMGVTPLSNIEPLTMKEIHLDNGNLVGREVVIKGAVVGGSPYSTYLILSDETARLLVVLTDIDPLMPKASAASHEVVSILGTVESGKKGLPYLKASSVHVMHDPSQS